jgi:hypothetical protein
MAHFYTRKESQLKAKVEKAKNKEEKLRHKDLMWAAKRRYLTDAEWYELHRLDRTHGKWGPEQAEYEFGVLGELREYYSRNSVGSKCPALNALERHIALNNERQLAQSKAAEKNAVAVKPVGRHRSTPKRTKA